MSKYLEDLVAFYLALKIQELRLNYNDKFSASWVDNLMDKLLRLKQKHYPDEKYE